MHPARWLAERDAEGFPAAALHAQRVKAIHVVAEALYRDFAHASNHDSELRHKAIIDRFGRYPHRNEILGRTSTPEEVEFLAQPGSRF